MSVAAVLAPVFVQVALCYALLFGLVASEPLARRAGGDVWPKRIGWINRSYSNQFELPVLFFGLVPLALITHQADAVFVVLTWLFVLARVAQAAVHVSVNVIPLRGACFVVGAMVLGIAWVKLAFAIFLPG